MCAARIDFGGGLPLNNYRVKGGLLEFRAVDPIGPPYGGGNSDWRVVDKNEIRLHYALATVVSKWLRVRLAYNGEGSFGRTAQHFADADLLARTGPRGDRGERDLAAGLKSRQHFVLVRRAFERYDRQ